MPRLGLGTFKVRGEDATRATLAALRAGCRHVDTASCYRNEEAIRDAVEMWKDETKGGGADADDAAVFLTSKLAPSEMGNPARTHEALLGVLVRLGRETREVKEEDEGFRDKGLTETRLVPKPLDLALVHWPAKAGAAPDDASHFVARRDAWRVLERAKDAGYVRAIGVSNYCASCLEGLGAPVPAVNQIQVHVGVGADPEGLLSYCKQQGIAVQAYSPLAHGAVVSDPLCQRVGAAANRSAAQVGLRWVLDRAPSLVVKASKKEYLVDDLDVFGWALPRWDLGG